MAIELVPLGTVHVQLKPPIEVGPGPAGTRMIFEIASVQVKGDRLSGECWVPQPQTGYSSVLRARERLTSARRSEPMMARPSSCSTRAGGCVEGHAAPDDGLCRASFRDSDERYTWLNRIQAIGKGTLNED